MKYSDLIQFEPIESVIELRDANKAERAKTLVNTYVISDVMAERLTEGILPQLRYDQPGDAKGLLVVGNYGTGKSHLMSVLSSVAEHGELLEELSNKAVKEAAGPVAGKFKVIRMEIGSTEMGLRDIITQNIEKQLREWNIDFKFPPADKITENKTSFEDLMAAFDAEFPGSGLLVVVDELLDYLRSRNEQALTLDLGFLREIGEVCKDLRFRFIAGVQEAIFDSDRFAFVAESVSRVKDRFKQIRIQKTDITYVVANRLLKKTEHQKAKVREYLEPFAKFYNGWTEALPEFVDLFPVHPNYIQTFERLPIVEQRGVLQVLSLSFDKMADQEVPEDHPGLLALDSFWSYIKDNPHFRTHDDLKDTIECSDTLASKIDTGFPKNRRQYKGMAQRIVEGLSVHRLTTSNINAPIGMTPEEIRDQLCLYHPFVVEMGGDPDEDLLTLVNVTLKEIKSCVSGQFISQNDDNRQWYLDLKKTEDFDALIEKRAESLNDEDLDLAYFSVLSQVMEANEPSEFTGFRIWESAMPWNEKNVTKLGWLFFGVPSERSTAQPPRDFYVYFPQIIDPPKFKDEKKADEVFFRVDATDEKFRDVLGRYAAALALKANASGTKKQEYARKSENYFKDLARWLRENFLSKVKVTYRGSTKSLSQTLAGENASGLTTLEQVFLAASKHLNEHFEEICGDYPKFTRQLTFGRNGNIEQAVQDALRSLHTNATQTGAAVLDGLSLYDGEQRIEPRQSPYAKFVLERIAEKGHGQVLNRSELIQNVDGIDYFLAPGKFRLEVELLIVVLGALVHSGETILSIPGKDFSATDLADLSARPIRDLLDFKHLKQPKDWNVPAIKALFELLGLPPGLAVKVTHNDNEAVVQLGTELNQWVEKLVLMRQEFSGGIPFWGTKLLKDDEIAEASDQLDSAKQFLESLQAYNTPAKLKNFKYSAEEVAGHRPALDRAREIEALKAFADSISEYTAYLSNAQSILPDDHPWCGKSRKLKSEICQDVLDPKKRASSEFRNKVIRELKALKQEYIDIYLDAYRHSRLDLHLDKRKQALLNDAKMQQLKALATIPTMNVSQLTEIQSEFGRLKTGDNITRDDLEETPVAGEFYPAMESPEGISAEQRLNNLEQRIEATHKAWTEALLNEFEDPVTQENLKLIDANERKQLESFIAAGELPDDVDREFVQAVQQALSGLSRVVVSPKALEAALFPSGAATTVEDFKDRFAAHLDSLIKGQDRAKVRLVLGERKGEEG